PLTEYYLGHAVAEGAMMIEARVRLRADGLHGKPGEAVERGGRRGATARDVVEQVTKLIGSHVQDVRRPRRRRSRGTPRGSYARRRAIAPETALRAAGGRPAGLSCTSRGACGTPASPWSRSPRRRPRG